MTITPTTSPQDGTLTHGQPPIPDHIAAAPEADFIAFALEWKKRVAAGKDTLNDRALVEAWLAHCSKTGSVQTLKTYLRHITRYRAFHRQWLELPPTEQTNERLLAPGDPECIEAFAASLRQMVNTLDNNGKPKLAISTYNCCIAAISSFYKWCSQPARRAFSGVPLSPVPSGLQLQKETRKAKSLSSEALHQVFYGARSSKTSPAKRRDELIIRLVYLLGTRATETVNLRWSDLVQLDSGPAIHVRAETAKGHKERFIPIDQTVLELLDNLKAAQPASDWLLPSPRNPSRHMARQGLWKLVTRAGNTVGIKSWPHQLRHTHATHAYALTHDPKLVQSTLGHADISTTMGLYVDETDGDSSTKHLTQQ